MNVMKKHFEIEKHKFKDKKSSFLNHSNDWKHTNLKKSNIWYIQVHCFFVLFSLFFAFFRANLVFEKNIQLFCICHGWHMPINLKWVCSYFLNTIYIEKVHLNTSKHTNFKCLWITPKLFSSFAFISDETTLSKIMFMSLRSER